MEPLASMGLLCYHILYRMKPLIWAAFILTAERNVFYDGGSMIYRISDRPFDTVRFAVLVKERLSSTGRRDGYTPDVVSIMEECADRFADGIY